MDEILKIASDRYDVGLGGDATALGWAAEHAAKTIGADAAKAGLKAINAKRRRQGRIPVTFNYGHPLF